MKVIKYSFNGVNVEMDWNEVNEETAKREADNGEYAIIDVVLPTVTPNQ